MADEDDPDDDREEEWCWGRLGGDCIGGDVI
jgi:hypothetical protein